MPADLVQGALVALGVASLNFADIWLYIVDPVVGGVAAALLYTNLLKPES